MRKTTATVFRQAPKHAVVLSLLAVGGTFTSQAERDRVACSGMATFIEMGAPLVKELVQLFVSHGLEDTRQV